MLSPNFFYEYLYMSLNDILYTYREADKEDWPIFYDAYLSNAAIPINKIRFKDIFDNYLLDRLMLVFIFEKEATKSIVGGTILKKSNELFIENGFVEIQHMHILSKYRRLNAATQLYAFIEEIAKDNKATKIMVSCSLNSTLNQRFYLRNKFVFSKKIYQKNIE